MLLCPGHVQHCMATGVDDPERRQEMTRGLMQALGRVVRRAGTLHAAGVVPRRDRPDRPMRHSQIAAALRSRPTFGQAARTSVRSPEFFNGSPAR